MKTSLKVDILKVAFVLSYLLFVFAAVKAWSYPSKECGTIPFSTEIIKYDLVDNCYQVTLEVTHNDEARYELSHANFYFGCGTIDNIFNSEGWPMEIISWDQNPIGLKVDDIKNFGKDPSFTSFTVEFTFCPDEQKEDECAFEPKVEYKAGQCVYYEKLDPESNNDTETPSNELLYEISAIPPTCSGKDGMIEITINQGTEPVEIVWDHGSIGPLTEGLSEGTYTYTITDGLGYEEIGEVVLQAPSDIAVAGSVAQPACNGLSNGSISLSISGGEEPYAILWNNGASATTLTDLGPGTYSVKVTDVKGCSTEETFLLSNENTISLITEVIQPSCQEGYLGSISLTASGGSAPYQYTWDNGMTDASLTNLVDGYYQVSVTDANGCSLNRTFAIRTDIGIEATSIVKNTNCFNDAAGAIDLEITGGTAPINIEWTNGEKTEDISNLTSGYYTATITDANNCQITHRAYVRVDNINISYDDIVIPSCHGGDGAIYITAGNGQEPYAFTWHDEAGNLVAEKDDAENLSSGKYTLTVTDGAGCLLEKAINLQTAPLFVSHEITTDMCTGEQTVEVKASGGTPEYTFNWSNGSVGEVVYGIQPGAYSVIVTDSKGCAESLEILIEEPLNSRNCVIDDLIGEVECGSTGNTVSSSVTNADFYSWTIASSDGNWSITSVSNQSSAEFSAGSAGSNGILKLTLGYIDGCEISCEKVIDVCIDNPDNSDEVNPDDTTGNPDGNNDEDPNGSDPNGSDPDSGDHSTKDCDECFHTNPVAITSSNGSYMYSIEVAYSECNYDLSHLTVEIPECFKIKEYSNSMNWKMEIVHNDPTTGISGIKVDDIPAFGKDPDLTSFMVYLTLTSWDPDCMEEYQCFAPKIAYKAATCVYIEQTESQCDIEEMDGDAVKTFPNPTCDYLHVDKKDWDNTSSYTADLIGFYGKKIKSYYFQQGYAKDFDIDMTSCKQGTYFLQIRGSNGDCTTHRIIKY